MSGVSTPLDPVEESEDAGCHADVAYLQSEYFKEYSAKSLQKAFRVHVAVRRGDNLWFAPHWSGVLGTLPGSGSGPQSMESFHAMWQRVVAQSTRPSCVRVLPAMQELFADVWPHPQCALGRMGARVFFGGDMLVTVRPPF